MPLEIISLELLNLFIILILVIMTTCGEFTLNLCMLEVKLDEVLLKIVC